MILHIQNCYIFIFRFAKGTHNFKKNRSEWTFLWKISIFEWKNDYVY